MNTTQPLEALSATLTMTLIADSGYTADHESRIGPNQWGAICAIADGNEIALQAVIDALAKVKAEGNKT